MNVDCRLVDMLICYVQGLMLEGYESYKPIILIIKGLMVEQQRSSESVLITERHESREPLLYKTVEVYERRI